MLQTPSLSACEIRLWLDLTGWNYVPVTHDIVPMFHHRQRSGSDLPREQAANEKRVDYDEAATFFLSASRCPL